jgi:hypothetical protein
MYKLVFTLLVMVEKLGQLRFVNCCIDILLCILNCMYQDIEVNLLICVDCH